MDKDEANCKLRFGIGLLNGKGCEQVKTRAISDAITIRNELKDAGFWWQAERMTNWINLAHKKVMTDAKQEIVPDMWRGASPANTWAALW